MLHREGVLSDEFLTPARLCHSDRSGGIPLNRSYIDEVNHYLIGSPKRKEIKGS